ncbi:MAG TPA: helix-turn-helix domain-containing protein [Caulobacteraceae bacterium]|nr:helix-turn-helix domain-containing protein [Caulobacteraceae bacterium]
MVSVAVATRQTYVDRESLNRALASDLVAWTVSETRDAPLLTHVAPHRLGDIRLLELSGNPFGAVRGRAEISEDSDRYLGILYQRSGSTLCRIGEDSVIVGPGEISVWHSERPVSFEMPEKFDKLCMIVPIRQFESVLYNAETYESLRLPADSNLAMLLGSYLSTLTNSVMTRNDHTPFDAVDVTLELLGAAFRAQRRSSTIAPRDQLFARISAYIEGRLEDANLSPKKIAEDNGISVRYLYTLFGEQGLTVSGWVRRRRLLRCRAELDGADTGASITEIAYRWGLNDSAHFSRLFKASFGMSPTQYRSSRWLGASSA